MGALGPEALIATTGEKDSGGKRHERERAKGIRERSGVDR